MVANFGNPFVEQDQLLQGSAYVELGLEAVRITGEDRCVWLHNLTTAPVGSMSEGESLEALILDSAGHIAHACAVAADSSALWLLTDAGRGKLLADFLLSMRFMARVEVCVSDVVTFGIAHADIAVPVLDAADLVWRDPWPSVTAGGAHYGVEEERHPGRGHARTVLVVQACKREKLLQALGAQGYIEVGVAAWEALRIADWRPRPNAEIVDGKVLPHELDWLRTAVWLNKGCFPGQETVAKVVNMGKPPRRLVYLYVEGPEGELPPAGTEVLCEGAPVGVITSIARHCEEGPVALALVRRSVDSEAVLQLAADTAFVATQEPIVFPAGRSSVSPEHIPGADLRRARAGLSEAHNPAKKSTR